MPRRQYRRIRSRRAPITKKEPESALRISNLSELGLWHDDAACVKFFQKHGLLRDTMECPQCNTGMVIEKTDTCQDQSRFRCQGKECRITMTVRKGSLFERSHLSLPQLVTILYGWALELPQRQVAYEGCVTERVVGEWYARLREICATYVARTRCKVGSNSCTISIDENAMTHRPKASNRRARSTPGSQVWLFGGICNEHREIFLELVPTETGRTATTMLRLIKENIAPGATIWSDEFASYKRIDQQGMGWTHRTVKHLSHYKCPVWGTCTNPVENLWRQSKAGIRKKNGVTRERIESYLKEFEFRWLKDQSRIFEYLLEAIAMDPQYGTRPSEQRVSACEGPPPSPESSSQEGPSTAEDRPRRFSDNNASNGSTALEPPSQDQAFVEEASALQQSSKE